MLTQILIITALLLGPAGPPCPVQSPVAQNDKPAGHFAPHIGALGITGATMVTASLAVLIVGSVNLNRRFLIGPNYDDPVPLPHAPGRALVGLGAVGAAAGISALAFDLVFRARVRPRRGMTVYFDVGRTGGGVSFTGRF